MPSSLFHVITKTQDDQWVHMLMREGIQIEHKIQHRAGIFAEMRRDVCVICSLAQGKRVVDSPGGRLYASAGVWRGVDDSVYFDLFVSFFNIYI